MKKRWAELLQLKILDFFTTFFLVVHWTLQHELAFKGLLIGG